MSQEGWIIVTGGNTGIGFEVCKRLVAAGHRVILCSRDKARGEAAVKLIQTTVAAASIDLMVLDLSDMASVRRFVDDFTATGKELSVLINNGGMALSFRDAEKHCIGPNNWEITMTTNHLGPFLLTNLLTPHLKKHAAEHGEARIVVVASSLTEWKRQKLFDVSDIMYEKPGAYDNGGEAYKNSKAANIMFTYELARRLDKSGVTVNCLCPGFIPTTELVRHSGNCVRWIMNKIIGGPIGTKLFRIPAVTVDVGAERVINVAVGAGGKGDSGLYFKHGVPAVSAEDTRQEDKQRELWETSARLTELV